MSFYCFTTVTSSNLQSHGGNELTSKSYAVLLLKKKGIGIGMVSVSVDTKESGIGIGSGPKKWYRNNTNKNKTP